jgi:hypothetical protein
LARLANLSRIVNVTNLELDGTKQKSRAARGRRNRDEPRTDENHSDHTLTASFIATAYSLRDPAAPAPKGAPAEKSARPVRTKNASQASTAGSHPKASSGSQTKRLSDKAKQPVEGEQ